METTIIGKYDYKQYARLIELNPIRNASCLHRKGHSQLVDILCMGSDVAEVEETCIHPRGIKVHYDMCMQLLTLVDRVCAIFPDIEAAQPRCTAGIEALCLLRNAIERARLLIQQCGESSKLYLAIIGERIVSRCERTKSLMEKSLNQLQTMVPVVLELEISQLNDDLRGTVFSMDSSEEEAGKVLLAVLQQDNSDSTPLSEVEAFRFAASRLHLVSRKDLVIETRSIKKLLDKVNDNDTKKRTILHYFLKLLKKYGVSVIGDQTESPSGQYDRPLSLKKSNNKYSSKQFATVESRRGCTWEEAETDKVHRPLPPEEFKCPLSSRLMYDPVVIESGQTFEKMNIQKWFGSGHETCPVTRVKLENLSLTPNTAMRDLISKWCKEHGCTRADPNLQPSVCSPVDASSNSIMSNVSSLAGVHLQIDLSNVSLGSADSFCTSDSSSHHKAEDVLNLSWSDNSYNRHQYYSSVVDREMESLSSISTLPWEAQCILVEDITRYFRSGEDDYFSSSKEVMDPLIVFLTNAADKHDIKALKAGCQLLLAFLGSRRYEIPSLSEDIYALLASFLETDVTEEVLAIMGLLSCEVDSGSKLAASSALDTLVGFLDTKNRKIQEAVLRILCNLSSTAVVRSLPEFIIPKLSPSLGDDSLAGLCIVILRNLCEREEAKISIAETKGCIASIVELLDIGGSEDQENAVSILISLCAQRVQYCRLVMDEGVIPYLVLISVNGSEKGKAYAAELLRLLKDVDYEDVDELPGSEDNVVYEESYEPYEEKVMLPPKTSGGFFRRKMAAFSKPSLLVTKKR